MSQRIRITIYNFNNVDLAIAEAVLNKLGLKTNKSRMEFIDTYGYKDLVLFFKDAVNLPINQTVKAKAIGEIKQYGNSVIFCDVSEKLITDIKEFLAVRENKILDRIKDGVKQDGVAAKNALDGINKNLAEADNDIDKGAGRTAHGLWNSLTSPVGSQRFGEGVSDLKDGLSQFGKGLFKLEIQTPVDAAAMMIGSDADRFQTLIGLENIGRSLNAVEKVLLMNIFGGSLLYDEIIIKEGYAGVLNAGYDGDKLRITENQRAITRGNTIYMKNNPVGSLTWKSTLVHETTHVWQNQNGGTDYMSEALYAQIFGEGYDYADAITKYNKTWIMLNPEQQAQLIQDAFLNEYFTNGKWSNKKPIPDSSGNMIPTQLLINYMNKVMPQVRAGLGAT